MDRMNIHMTKSLTTHYVVASDIDQECLATLL